MKGVILDIETDGTYTIGHGTLKKKYARSQFIPTSGNLLEVQQIPEREVTSR